MSNKNFDILNKVEELPSKLYIAVGIIVLALYTVLAAYVPKASTQIGLACVVLYASATLLIYFVTRRRIAAYREEAMAAGEQNREVVSVFREEIDLAYCIVSENGNIVTLNDAMKAIVPSAQNYFNLPLSSLFEIDVEAIIAASQKTADDEETDEANGESKKNEAPTVAIGGRRFRISCYPMSTNGHIYYMLTFSDFTELYELSKLHYDTTPAVAYILLDNLDEIAQYVKSGYAAEVLKVDTIIKNWAQKMNAVLREYDRDKYMLIFDRQCLASCIEDKFSVLDEVREIKIGDEGFPITISMGVAITGSTLAERESDALSSLDLALQRGGDQVVLKNEDGTSFFGGLTKSQQKRTLVHSRMVANKLCSMIKQATNVVIMGHASPDFDSIGACVGIAALSMYLGTQAHIVADKTSQNFLACTENLISLKEYKNIFVDSITALELCSYGTLLVIVDANNFEILEAPEIAKRSFTTAVIDHHIKKSEFEDEPALSYIDPSSSSACELVSEILELTLPERTLRKEEATILLSGIMVDTKNFTRTVGTRTFSAALYLRAQGANAEVARTFFNKAFEDYRAEANFGAHVQIYNRNIAISVSKGTDPSRDRVAAARAADKLLNVREVEAAFALVKIGDNVHVSARSRGKINVQLILERIGGGGHFDVAGASIPGLSLIDARTLVIDAISKYLEERQ